MDAIRQKQNSTEARKRGMQLLARATPQELQVVWDGIEHQPDVSPVRGPETGMIMVRGRIGGGGAPFNLGEATVSRATIRLDSGEIGHAQLLGTDRAKARLAAVFDALGQRPEFRSVVDDVLAAIEGRIAMEECLRNEQTAATRVDFFTMVRGDD